MGPSFLHPVEFTFQRRHGKNNIILRQCAIVNHSTKGGFVPCFFRFLAICVNSIYYDITAAVLACSACFVSKTDHFPGIGIEFWVGGKSGGGDLSVEIPFPDCVEGGWVHGKGRAVLFCSKKNPAVEYNIRIGSSSDDSLYYRVI